MQGASTTYWSDFWCHHGSANRQADPCEQVLRTQGGLPISSDVLCQIDADVLAKLDVARGHIVADLGCGNGRFSRLVAPQCRHVLACDVSPDLLEFWPDGFAANIDRQVADLRDQSLPPAHFDRMLAYAVLQYFEPKEAVGLFGKWASALRAGGHVLVGDIPDATRMWQFFDTPHRRSAYFNGLVNNAPIVGTWFDPQWITQAAYHAGFTRVQILLQPESLPYAHFRFDAILAR
jgi:cyclopropane fatty-acyl-phospholipid synthase-like methyltransferase